MGIPNYSKKSDLKESAGNDISNLPSKVDLASLKTQIVKLNVEEMRTAPLLK